MDPLGITAFLAIVQTRNLTKAGELLHLSQSTVSHRLQVLEKNLGEALVERGKGRQSIELTPFGSRFASLAERWNLLNLELTAMQAEGAQLRLNFGVADSLNLYVLPPLYQRIIRQFPNLSLRILTLHTAECYEGIERRDLDMAFVNVEKVLPHILTEPFYVDEMVLVRLATAGHNPDEAISPAELDFRHEFYFNWGPAYQLWRERWRDTGAPFRLQVDAAALIFYTMWDERQWAVVPRSVAKAFARPEQFVVQSLTDPPPSRICYRLQHKHQEKLKQPYLEKIASLLQQIFSGVAKE